MQCQKCGTETMVAILTTIEFPEMRMHDENEPIYGDGHGHFWYEGEKAQSVDKDILRCPTCGHINEPN